MAQWLLSMSHLQRVFAYIALAGTFALVIQLVLLVIGLGGGHDADGADHDHDFAGHDHDHEFGAHEPGDHDHAIEPHDHEHEHGPGDHEHDHDHDSGLRLFTLRGIVAFFAIMGWSGLALLRSGLPTLISVPLAAVLGLMAMLLMAMAMRTMLRLQVDGSLNLRLAVGREGAVYIPIPPDRKGEGKVMLTVQERLVELSAVSDSLQTIPAGAKVFVADVLDDGVLLVEPSID